MAFDVAGAIQAGYSPAEIADHLGQRLGFDVAGARQAGYTDADIISRLSSGPAPVSPTKPQTQEPSQPSKNSGFVNFIRNAAAEVQATLPGPMGLMSPKNKDRTFLKSIINEVRSDPGHALEAAARGAEKELVPTLAGAGAAGLTSKAAAPLAAKLIGKGLEAAPNPLAKGAGYALEYGAPLLAAVTAGRLTQAGQEKALEAAPEAAEALGLSPDKIRELEQKYPTMSTLGGVAPGFLVGKPPSLKNLGSADAAARAEAQQIMKQGSAMTALQSGLNLGEQLWNAGGDFSKVDLGQVATSGALGFLQARPTRLGETLMFHGKPGTVEAPPEETKQPAGDIRKPSDVSAFEVVNTHPDVRAAMDAENAIKERLDAAREERDAAAESGDRTALNAALDKFDSVRQELRAAEQRTLEISQRVRNDRAQGIETSPRKSPLVDITSAPDERGLLDILGLKKPVDNTPPKDIEDEYFDQTHEPNLGEPKEEAPKGPTSQERIKQIQDRIVELASKRDGELTKQEADEIKQLTDERAELVYPIDRRATEETLSKTKPENRKSTLDNASTIAISNDVHGSLPIFKLIEQHSMGHDYGETPIDKIMRGESESVSPQEFYDAFNGTREALRAQYGDTIPLFRAVTKRKGTPVTNWATTREFAEQFGKDVVSRDIPVDDIVAANVTPNGKYHELIVGDRANGAKIPVRESVPKEEAPKGEALKEEPPKEESVDGFMTAKGSTYEVTPEGKTIRTKRSEGEGQGKTYEPHSVLYVNPGDHMEILSDMQGGMGDHSVRIGYVDKANSQFTPVRDTKLIPEDGIPAVAVVNKKTNDVVGIYDASTKPELGLHPVEKLYKPDGTSSTHVGNEIVSLGKPEPAPKLIVAPPRRKNQMPDSSRDSILQFLARHGQGLSSDEAIAQGIDPASFKNYDGNPASVGQRRNGKNAFRKNGMSFDEAAGLLAQHGYPVVDEKGNYDPNVLLDRIDDELRGTPHLSQENTFDPIAREHEHLTSTYPDVPVVPFESAAARNYKRAQAGGNQPPAAPPPAPPPPPTPPEPPAPAGGEKPSGPRRLKPEPEPEQPELQFATPAERIEMAKEGIRKRANQIDNDPAFSPRKIAKTFRENIDNWLDKLKTNHQNIFWHSEKIHRRMMLQKNNPLIISGDKANALFMRQASMDAVFSDIQNTQVEPLVSRLTSAVHAYAMRKGESVKVAVQTIGDMLKALHAPERRNEFWIRYRPLKETVVEGAAGSETGLSPAKIRQKLYAEYAKIKANKEMSYEEKLAATKKIREQLHRVVSDSRNADPLGASPAREMRGYFRADGSPLPMPTNITAELYAPAHDTHPANMETLRMMLGNELADKDIGPALREVLGIHDELVALHRKLNKESGSWAENTDLDVDGLYQFEHYAALKSKAGEYDPIDLEGTRNTGDVAGYKRGMEGGRHVVENPLLQMIADTSRAARKASREGITLRVKNLIDQGHLEGEHVATIPASEQFMNNDILEAYPEAKNSKSIYHKLANGDIEVYHVNDEGVLDGLRRPADDMNAVVKFMQRATSGIAQQFTRFRLAFYPYNFFKHTEMNAILLARDYAGEIGKFDYPMEVLRNAANGNGFKGLQYARLYRTNINKLRDIAKNDPYAKNVLEWMTRGGPALYGDMLNTEKAYQKFNKLSTDNVAAKGWHKAWDAFDAGMDYWAKSWDFLSRATAFDMIKKLEYPKIYEREIKSGKSESEAHAIADEEAAQIGVFKAKQLANFSLHGKNRTLPALYMFMRPAATTVARTMEAIAPAWRNQDAYLKKMLPPEDLKDPEKVAYAKAQLKKESAKSSGMVSTLLGMGMSLYAMNYMLGMVLPKDSQGRNRVGQDNKEQSVRGFRVPIGNDKYLNIPFGFGPGGLIALGYQTAAFLNPADSQFMDFKGYGGHLLRIGNEMLLPIQASGMDPIRHPWQFVADTVAPSVLKAPGELAMNMDSLGNKIFNDTPGRISDVYTGGAHVPQIYKDIADHMYKTVGVEVPPNVIRFMATNWFDGVADMASMGDEAVRGVLKAAGMPGGKTPDVKPFLGSFVGNQSNLDSAHWSSINEQVKKIKQDMDTATATGDVDLTTKAIKKHALDSYATTAFNESLGRIRNIEKQMKEFRANQNIPLDSKDKILQQMESQLNLEKRLAVERVKPFGLTP